MPAYSGLARPAITFRQFREALRRELQQLRKKENLKYRVTVLGVVSVAAFLAFYDWYDRKADTKKNPGIPPKKPGSPDLLGMQGQKPVVPEK